MEKLKELKAIWDGTSWFFSVITSTGRMRAGTFPECDILSLDISVLRLEMVAIEFIRRIFENPLDYSDYKFTIVVK